MTSVAPAMASALIISSGRKTSPLSKSSPTSWMPLTKPFCMMSAGARPCVQGALRDLLGGGAVGVDDGLGCFFVDGGHAWGSFLFLSRPVRFRLPGAAVWRRVGTASVRVQK